MWLLLIYEISVNVAMIQNPCVGQRLRNFIMFKNMSRYVARSHVPTAQYGPILFQAIILQFRVVRLRSSLG